MKKLAFTLALLAAGVANAAFHYATMVSQQPFGEVVLSWQQSDCNPGTKSMQIGVEKKHYYGCYRIADGIVYLSWQRFSHRRPESVPETLPYDQFTLDPGEPKKP